MNTLFNIVTGISFITAFIFLLFICVLFGEAFQRIRSKISLKNTIKDSILPFNELLSDLLPKALVVVTYIFIIIGTIHAVIFIFYKNTIIGSFYESSNYESQYKCTLTSNAYEDYGIITCDGVATICKSENHYTVTKIQIASQLETYYDAEYFPDSSRNTITTNNFKDWDIMVSKEPCPNEYAISVYDKNVSSGTICGSSESNVYHNKRCGYVKNIHESSLIYFPNTAGADLMKYRPCERCGKWASTK